MLGVTARAAIALVLASSAFATLLGSAASLGLGALQIGTGLQLNGWTDSVGTGLLVTILFVLGADAASIGMGTLSERGTVEPRRLTSASWGCSPARWWRSCWRSATAATKP